MAAKWRARAAQVGEELETTGRLVVGSPALERWAEHAIRFLLGAVLSCGELFGGWAPFGVGMTACSGSGVDGLCALAGAALGYLLFHGFARGLRYAAACVLVFSVAFAFYDVGLYKKSWFMPLVAAAMDAATGFVYLSDSDWAPAQVIFFSTEVLFAGACAYFYRQAFALWRTRRQSAPLTLRQGVSLAILAVSLLISLAGIEFFGDLSLGRVAAVLLVLSAAHAAGPGAGAALGVAAGLSMDLSCGGAPFYTMAYGFSGLLTGAGWKQGRLFAALSYVVSNAVAVLWTWESQPRISGLYEVFIASVLFLAIPQSLHRRISAALARQSEATAARWGAEAVRDKLSALASAFRSVRDSLRAAFPDAAPNDADPASVFDRTAERICRTCVLRNTCWEQDYVSTFNALNDALPAMLEKGKGEPADFPTWFPGRCLRFGAFLAAANEELTALRFRRQYQSRIQESRSAVCRQYETLSDILTAASLDLSAELIPDPAREKRLRRHLAALGLEGEAAVYYDRAGHLRAEVSGESLAPLETDEEQRKLSDLMGLPLRPTRENGRLVFLQTEPLMAVAGLAARRREGQEESGDAGTWFKRSDGSLFVLLCDGMGSGRAAHRESALAVRLLEEFLRSGMDSAAALRTVNSALALRNEETGAFTTVDLLRLDLFTGTGELCKLGAAPTYLRKAGAVSALTGTTLPAGLTDGPNTHPDVTSLTLEAGDVVVLLSDGVTASEDDSWLRDLLTAFPGDSPKDLARQVMEESESRVGASDDRTAVVIALKKR